jgi:hypothetical protein
MQHPTTGRSAGLLSGFLVVTGLVFLLMAAGLALQWPRLLALWPWADDYSGLSPLSALFLASIAAAIGAPVLWIGWRRDWRAIQGGAINLAITFTGSAAYMALEAFRSEAAPRGLTGLAAGLLVAAGLMLAWAVWSGRQAPLDKRPTPRPVRIAFALFILVLLAAGGALVLRVPQVMPWPITPAMSVIYGWIFLGAAAYFAAGLRLPVWTTAQGPLIGFLAYDLVLIVPFLRHFAQVQEPLRASLTVYTGVLVFSGVLAVVYLLRQRVR